MKLITNLGDTEKHVLTSCLCVASTRNIHYDDIFTAHCEVSFKLTM